MNPAPNSMRFYPGQFCLMARRNPPRITRAGKPGPQYEVDRILCITADGIQTARHGLYRTDNLTSADGLTRLARPDHVTDLPKPGWYVQNWRRLNAIPDTDTRPVYPFWNWAGCSIRECKESTRAALHSRINARGNYRPPWRKYNDDLLEAAWRRDQRKIQDHLSWRLIIRQFETPEVKQRFSHLLTRPEDE